MASLKLDKYGIYPLDIFHSPCAWITPEDIVNGMYALARENKAERNYAAAEYYERLGDKLSVCDWYTDFMIYKNESLRSAS